VGACSASRVELGGLSHRDGVQELTGIELSLHCRRTKTPGTSGGGIFDESPDTRS
jgi:hypothetical protein